jgi:signal recognition particle subunit SRP54
MVAVMTGEERHMLQLIWQSVRGRQIIDAMTDEERSNPDLVDSSRRARIASSSGTHPQDVEQLLAAFQATQRVVCEVANMSLWERMKLISSLTKPAGKEARPN